MGGIIPELFDRKRYNEDGVGGMHVYTPWWLDNKKLDFPGVIILSMVAVLVCLYMDLAGEWKILMVPIK